ncbi:MAG: M20/M25/M40 family metallo-hydrolase [Bacteroidales bacterium]
MKILLSVALVMLLACPVHAQKSLGEDIAYKVKKEALVNSHMDEFMQYNTDLMGPRLPGSKLMTRAEDLAVKKLKDLGLTNVRVEEASNFAKGGWDNLKTYAAMTAPYYCNFYGIPKAWSGSTNGLVAGQIIALDVKNEEDIAKYKGTLSGKIVLMPSTFEYTLNLEPLASRYTDEELAKIAKDPRGEIVIESKSAYSRSGYGNYNLTRMLTEMVVGENPAVIVSGRGNFNIPTAGSVSYKSGDKEPIAELILPAEAHARMVRLAKSGTPVSMEIEIKNEFTPNCKINNVIGEIQGCDPKLKDEVVLLGAHLDSWHGGTGAADNASGVMVMMEAMRIIKALGISPKRTIRIALWGGEEQGFVGSRGYVGKYLYDRDKKAKKEDYDKFALYLNMDNGSGKFRGIYLEENDMALPFFKEWCKHIESFGFNTLTLGTTWGTDHQPFQGAGLPGFQFIQDELDYGRTYHTPMDTYERLSVADLKYNAAVTAWIAISAAMDNNKIPAENL